jgi:hypothetical protein
LSRRENLPAKLSEADLAALWRDLGSDDGERADRAIRTLNARPAYSIPLLKAKLRPAAPIEGKLVTRLIGELGSDQFAMRQKANQELENMDEQAGPALRKALGEAATLEAKQRIEKLLARLRSPITVPEMLRSYRGVEVLENIGTLESKEVLQSLAKGAPEARQTQEAIAALWRQERATKRTEK